MTQTQDPGAWAAELCRWLASDHPPMANPKNLPPSTNTTDAVPIGAKKQATALNGSWMAILSFKEGPAFWGVLRMDFRPDQILASGDFYREAQSDSIWDRRYRLAIPPNWYPQFPAAAYQWHFRSHAVSFLNQTLNISFDRHIWDKGTGVLKADASGTIQLGNSTTIYRPDLPRPTVQLDGQGNLEGRPFSIVAVKTSSYCRGCILDLDRLEGISFEDRVEHCDKGAFGLQSLFREAGMDLDVRSRPDHLRNPNPNPNDQDVGLTEQDLLEMLANTNNKAMPGNYWRVWLLIGTEWRKTSAYGLMFDLDGAHREGAAVFANTPLPKGPNSAWGSDRTLQRQWPNVMLRAVCHELGHVFNLVHPGDELEEHKGKTGVELMNETLQVVDFAGPHEYPCNMAFRFSRHNGLSLRHDPDPQIKPGWSAFGWGHAESTAGAIDLGGPMPGDGLDTVQIKLSLSNMFANGVAPGDFFFLTLSLTNRSDTPVSIPSYLNIASNALSVKVQTPNGTIKRIRHPIVACYDEETEPLNPEEPRDFPIAMLYTNHGFLFDAPGRYAIQVVTALSGREDGNPQISTFPMNISGPRSQPLDREIGLAFAMGDTGSNTRVQNHFKALAASGNTPTERAALIVLANNALKMGGSEMGDSLNSNRDNAIFWLDKARNGIHSKDLALLVKAVLTPLGKKEPLLDIL